MPEADTRPDAGAVAVLEPLTVAVAPGAEKLAWKANGTLLAAGQLFLALAVALVIGGTLSDIAYLAVSLIVVVWQTSAKRFETALELVLWIWATAPLIDKLADWRVGTSTPASLTSATAAVCTLVLGIACLTRKNRLPTPLLVYLIPLVVAVPVAAVVGLVQNGFAAVAVNALQEFAPFGAALAVCRTGSSERLVAAVLRFTRWALPLISAYAIFQWAVAPEWDTLWLRTQFPLAQVNGSSFGTPEAFGIRPWGTVTAPFVLAHVLVFLVFTQVNADRSLWKWPGVALGIFALAITGIRSQWVTAAVVLLVLVLSRRIKIAPLIAFGAAVAGIVAIALPDIAEKIWDRLSSFGSGTGDVSAAARLNTYLDAIPRLLGDPLGGGLGSAGRAALASGKFSTGAKLVDSNYLQLMRTYGSVFSVILIVTLFAVAGLALLRSLSMGRPYQAWGALAVALPVDLLLGNVTASFNGCITLIVITACLAAPMPNRTSPPSGLMAHERGGGHETT